MRNFRKVNSIPWVLESYESFWNSTLLGVTKRRIPGLQTIRWHPAVHPLENHKARVFLCSKPSFRLWHGIFSSSAVWSIFWRLSNTSLSSWNLELQRLESADSQLSQCLEKGWSLENLVQKNEHIFRSQWFQRADNSCCKYLFHQRKFSFLASLPPGVVIYLTFLPIVSEIFLHITESWGLWKY